MTSGNSVISHQFEVFDIAFRGTSVPTAVANELDYHGTLLGLERLPAERNAEYRRRLVDVYVHRANSSYTGLVNGITRELGLELFKPIRISTKPDIDPAWSPRVEFIDNVAYLWKDVFTKELDITIDHGNPVHPEYFLSGLVDAINASNTFQATLEDVAFAFKRADTIVNQSSSKFVAAQALNSSTVNHLGVSLIDRGSVILSDLVTFRIEVASVNLVNSPGKYFIDYENGVIASFNTPVDSAFVQYSFRQEDFLVLASPVIIRAVHSKEFEKIMFEQNIQPDNTLTSGTPTLKGASIINELLSVVPMYWGT
jgi:hypothetical protein